MRMRAFTRDAVFVVGLCNIVAGALLFFLFAQMLYLLRIEADVETLTPIVRIAALFLFVFGIGYLFASGNVERNHLMLFVGLLQNAGVAGIAAWYWLYAPGLMPSECLLPAGLNTLFALVFLIAWPAALVESRLQRRRANRARVVPSKPAGPSPARQPIASEHVCLEKKPAAEIPGEAGPSEINLPSTDMEPPEEPTETSADVPPLHPLAHRDRSGADHDETQDTSG